MLNLHLQHLVHLRATVEHDSLRDAAEVLGVSQPALSQSIRELERRIGVEVFTRVGRGKELTPTGREVYEYAGRVLLESSVFERRLSALALGKEGELHVGMIDAVCLYLFSDALRRFSAREKKVALNVRVGTSGELSQAVLEQELDLAFVVGPVSKRGLENKRVASEPLCLYGHEKNLSSARWLLYPHGSRTRAIVDRALQKKRIVPDVYLESSNPQVLAQMVEFGLGVAVLPEQIGEAHRPRLPRMAKTPLGRRDVMLVMRPGILKDPRVERFLSYF